MLHAHESMSVPRLSAASTLREVADHNAKWRSKVAQSEQGWITEANIERSVFDYGMSRTPLAMRTRLIGNEGDSPLQHDMISWLGLQTAAMAPLEYLEIGVSVLKGVSTQLHAWRNATVTAFDVEDPNPTQASHWGEPEFVAQWPLSGPRNKDQYKKPSGVTVRPSEFLTNDSVRHWPATAATRHNRVYYVASDATDPTGWTRMAAVRAERGLRPFNLIFSDGLHTPGALVTEFRQFKRAGMLATPHEGPLTVIWDDCGYALWQSVNKHVDEFARAIGRERLCFATFQIPGWTGTKDGSQTTCILSSLPREVLEPVMLKEHLASHGRKAENEGSGPKCRSTPVPMA